MASATIIRERPASYVPELSFDARGNCLWVLFEDDEYRSWCGIFGAGDLHYEGRVELLSGGDCAVLVSGRLYRVDVNQRVLRFRSDRSDLTDFIYVPARDLLVACDFIELFAYGRDGRLWRSGRVSLDGIALESADEDQVYGYVTGDYEYVSAPFTLYLDAMYVDSDVDRTLFG